MIVILGLIVVVAAVVVGVAGVLGNAHGLAHGFSVLGYHVTGSGTVFLYGIAVGAVALFGLWLLLAGARHTSRRGRAARRGLRQSRRETAQSRQETAAVAKDRDDLIGQRDTARANTASTLGSGAPPGNGAPPAGLDPSQDDGPRGRRRLFGHRARRGAGWPAGLRRPGRSAGARRPCRCSRARRMTPPKGSSPYEYRQEARAQGRSGQRQRQEDRRPAHRQPAPASRGPRRPVQGQHEAGRCQGQGRRQALTTPATPVRPSGAGGRRCSAYRLPGTRQS
jgi:hypothetical protein